MSQTNILTLQLDESAQAFYEDLRRRHFPSERNLIPAHLSLFHQLPEEPRVLDTLHHTAAATPAFLLTDPALRSIGRGVAVFFQGAPLRALHATLSSEFESYLIPQDRQRFQPHIVVQNKVTAETARQTLFQLQPTRLVGPQAIGLSLWRYLGGPWQHRYDVPFAALRCGTAAAL